MLSGIIALPLQNSSYATLILGVFSVIDNYLIMVSYCSFRVGESLPFGPNVVYIAL